MVEVAFKHFEGDDLDDFLQKVEKSFDITFEPFELAHINTIKEFSDHLVQKMKDHLSSGCTTQQAFYKLRTAVNKVTGAASIYPQTLWSDLLPVKNRRLKLNDIGTALGFEINILKPKEWIVNMFIAIFFASLIAFFFSWKIALSGLITAIAGLYTAYYYGKELAIQTVGEAAEQLTNQNYSKVRNGKGTINENEVEKVLLSLFLDTLGYTEEELASFTA